MASEKRLIDANALENLIRTNAKVEANDTKYDIGRVLGLINAADLIRNAPTVDAVEVVRCDECVHYIEPEDGDFLGRCTSGMVAVSHNGEIYPGRGFYCLYGERKKICRK